jgi:hypothetical protein
MVAAEAACFYQRFYRSGRREVSLDVARQWARSAYADGKSAGYMEAVTSLEQSVEALVRLVRPDSWATAALAAGRGGSRSPGLALSRSGV